MRIPELKIACTTTPQVSCDLPAKGATAHHPPVDGFRVSGGAFRVQPPVRRTFRQRIRHVQPAPELILNCWYCTWVVLNLAGPFIWPACDRKVFRTSTRARRPGYERSEVTAGGRVALGAPVLIRAASVLYIRSNGTPPLTRARGSRHNGDNLVAVVA